MGHLVPQREDLTKLGQSRFPMLLESGDRWARANQYYQKLTQTSHGRKMLEMNNVNPPLL